jgi:cysteine-S-conjugate beta-lyase
MARLQANRARVAEHVAAELPGVHHYSPEGTYLAWLDCRGLNLPTVPAEFFLERARVGLNAGADFGQASRDCVRLNFATSGAILDQVLERMATAVRTARTAKATVS